MPSIIHEFNTGRPIWARPRLPHRFPSRRQGTALALIKAERYRQELLATDVICRLWSIAFSVACHLPRPSFGTKSKHICILRGFLSLIGIRLFLTLLFEKFVCHSGRIGVPAHVRTILLRTR